MAEIFQPMLRPIIEPAIVSLTSPLILNRGEGGGGGVPENAITYNGQPVTYDGEIVTYTPAEE